MTASTSTTVILDRVVSVNEALLGSSTRAMGAPSSRKGYERREGREMSPAHLVKTTRSPPGKKGPSDEVNLFTVTLNTMNYHMK